MSAREVTHRYRDPLDSLWLETARRIGLRVARSEGVYAATDGRGALVLGAPETLDVDDCLAQMIVHELSHSLIEGPESFDREDWGLDNESDRDLAREHACLRLQALLTGRHGLRLVLAPTTDHRAFYDSLPRDPLAPREGADPALEREPIRLARVGAARAERAPWAPHLALALEATRTVVASVAPHAEVGSLFTRLEPDVPPHPSGLPGRATASAHTCAECAWQRPMRARARCEQAGAAIDRSWPACERFEPALDCRRCGACCREAYGLVELSRRDPFVRLHPELVRRAGERIVLERVEGRCPALEGDDPYTCRHYEERPRTCREFEVGRANCLEARRRVGLSL